ncbi:MAG: hypothetical protein OEW12_04110 [Deltaproteobacteria bacterium]|nr:hypothetical protein [Deltaproteobacteria bacterium]
MNAEKSKHQQQSDLDKERQRFLTNGRRVQRLPSQDEKPAWAIRPHRQRNKIMG